MQVNLKRATIDYLLGHAEDAWRDCLASAAQVEGAGHTAAAANLRISAQRWTEIRVALQEAEGFTSPPTVTGRYNAQFFKLYLDGEPIYQSNAPEDRGSGVALMSRRCIDTAEGLVQRNKWCIGLVKASDHLVSQDDLIGRSLPEAWGTSTKPF